MKRQTIAQATAEVTTGEKNSTRKIVIPRSFCASSEARNSASPIFSGTNPAVKVSVLISTFLNRVSLEKIVR